METTMAATGGGTFAATRPTTLKRSAGRPATTATLRRPLAAAALQRPSTSWQTRVAQREAHLAASTPRWANRDRAAEEPARRPLADRGNREPRGPRAYPAKRAPPPPPDFPDGWSRRGRGTLERVRGGEYSFFLAFEIVGDAWLAAGVSRGNVVVDSFPGGRRLAEARAPAARGPGAEVAVAVRGRDVAVALDGVELLRVSTDRPRDAAAGHGVMVYKARCFVKDADREAAVARRRRAPRDRFPRFRGRGDVVRAANRTDAEGDEAEPAPTSTDDARPWRGTAVAEPDDPSKLSPPVPAPRLAALERSICAPGTFDGADDCDICLAPLASKPVVRVPCQGGHVFHLGCLRPWLAKCSLCPRCRGGLKFPKTAGGPDAAAKQHAAVDAAVFLGAAARADERARIARRHADAAERRIAEAGRARPRPRRPAEGRRRRRAGDELRPPSPPGVVAGIMTCVGGLPAC
ncbi:hypothetical protein JL721_6828 [Aureococcus anophagefferens]|nr:hypothetical protein JL721_6828 [Aureococcus anophagefferens]